MNKRTGRGRRGRRQDRRPAGPAGNRPARTGGNGRSGGPDRRVRERVAKNRINGKIVFASLLIFAAFVLLLFRVYVIMRDNGENYKRHVLSQQSFDSTVIPYQRGAITDRNGTVLAYSERVYNVILDSYLLSDIDGEPSKYRDVTLDALTSHFDISEQEVRSFIMENPNSRYHILLKNVSYDEMAAYQEYLKEYNDEVDKKNKELAEDQKPFNKIHKRAIWFEDQFLRTYPGGSLACNVIGFTTGDGRGQYGLEEYYNDELTGVNGREYGYLSDENALERTVVPATNGKTLVSTIDAYLQRICEEKIKEYNEEHTSEYRVNELGSDNTGVIIMDLHSGEVLAMASYPYFDLNDPKDLSMYTPEQQEMLIAKAGSREKASQTLWKNFCISQSYEPGSVGKTYTVAAALDAGVIHDGDSFFCGGYLTFGDGATTIRCHQRYGDGELTLKQAVEKSCNVALMLIGQKLGKTDFLRYQRNFNFGLRTNIDLAGEMRTDSLVFNERTMGVTELMTSTFGQGFNVTMIQAITAFASLVNGGYYYQPHMVKQILDDNGAVVENIEPTVLRQVVSESVSDLMIEYCVGVVDEGTGTRARPAGYKIGGKTGTAERSGQGKRDYTVSFAGFAPADDPQIAIYVVIDRPNAASQEFGTRYACLLCRAILTEALPYLHIYPTEPLTEAEEKELQELKEKGIQPETVSDNSVSGNGVSGNAVSGNGASAGTGAEKKAEEKQTVTIKIDPATGYAIDPLNGEFLDPVTGVPINEDSSIFQGVNGSNIDTTEGETGEGTSGAGTDNTETRAGD